MGMFVRYEIIIVLLVNNCIAFNFGIVLVHSDRDLRQRQTMSIPCVNRWFRFYILVKKYISGSARI